MRAVKFIIVRFHQFSRRELALSKRFLLNEHFPFLSLFFSLSLLEAGFRARLRSLPSEIRDTRRNTRQNARKVSNFPRAVPAFSFSHGLRASFLVSAHRSRGQAHRRKIPGGKAPRERSWSRFRGIDS